MRAAIADSSKTMMQHISFTLCFQNLTPQAIQHLKELHAYFDANAGTFSEAEITFMQGLTSKTLSFRASRQVQSAMPFPRIPRLLQKDKSRDDMGCFRFLSFF